MIITNLEKSFNENVNRLLESQHWQSSMHTQSALRYYQERPLNEGKKVEERSFILIWENEPVIAFRGATVETNGTIDLLAYEVPSISFENKVKLTTTAAKTFLKEFDRIMKKVNGDIWYRDFLMNGELSILSRHLLRKGAKLIPVLSQVIDLSQDKATLKQQIRKSYNSLINWGLRELNPKIFDSLNITWGKIDAFRQLHIREAGRETRSKKSWQRQLEMVKAGEAFVVMGFLKEQLVTAGFFLHSKTNCYYGSSASRRDMFNKPLFHSLMWKGIQHAKKIGCCWFEVGEQIYPNYPQEPLHSNKELGISEFKAGFGGKTRMILDFKLSV